MEDGACLGRGEGSVLEEVAAFLGRCEGSVLEELGVGSVVSVGSVVEELCLASKPQCLILPTFGGKIFQDVHLLQG